MAYDCKTNRFARHTAGCVHLASSTATSPMVLNLEQDAFLQKDHFGQEILEQDMKWKLFSRLRETRVTENECKFKAKPKVCHVRDWLKLAMFAMGLCKT